jgi:hypothetical protein
MSRKTNTTIELMAIAAKLPNTIALTNAAIDKARPKALILRCKLIYAAKVRGAVAVLDLESPLSHAFFTRLTSARLLDK